MPVTDDQAYELLAHLVASAEICRVEPGYYGTFRLLDAASRLLATMDSGDGWAEALRLTPGRLKDVVGHVPRPIAWASTIMFIAAVPTSIQVAAARAAPRPAGRLGPWVRRNAYWERYGITAPRAN